MTKSSDKQAIDDLVQICNRKGIDTVIISPGSRNAPLTISFTESGSFNCLCIPDERSAAFFALGIAQQHRNAVALVCTSGTAVLNYSPAIAEAYYQKIPLLILTADRPGEWIDQGDGQTIRQRNIYANYIKASYQLPEEPYTEKSLREIGRIVSEAIDKTLYPFSGPVHINIPLKEPLYGTKNSKSLSEKIIETNHDVISLTSQYESKLREEWDSCSKKLILTGMLYPDPILNDLLEKVSEDPSVAILTETTSNLYNSSFNSSIDNVLFTIKEDEASLFQPDLLITLGDAVVSKKVKAFLRKNHAKHHWRINSDGNYMDTYKNLTQNIMTDARSMMKIIADWIDNGNSNYRKLWKDRDDFTYRRGAEYLQTTPWSDLRLFNILLKHIPANSQVHWGNSTPIRYSQLFKYDKVLTHFANRGTGGIDGCVSTAAGAAFARRNDIVTLVCGDMAFFYDSNALWNSHINNNLRIMIVNNSGGGIFRTIQGPDTTNSLEKYFEAKHNINAEHLAKTFGLDYLKSNNEDSFKESLQEFYRKDRDKAVILEAFTPNELNASVLKDYFKYLNKNSHGTDRYDNSKKLEYYKGIPGYPV